MSNPLLRTCPFCKTTFDPGLAVGPVFCPGCGNIPAMNEPAWSVPKLPTWVPRVRRPWNPAYREVWDHMTDNDKRWSFVVDAAIVLAVAILMLVVFPWLASKGVR